MNMKILESVGCAIDLNTGITYPLNPTGQPDCFAGTAVHFDDVCDEWHSALSPEDAKTVDEIRV